MNISDFGKSAQLLSKNPLGIIGLFLVLVYGVAGLVSTSYILDANDRIPLIYFLVFFPLFILFVFYRLVTKFNNKLYAPSDYKNEDNYMKAIENSTTNKKQDNEDNKISKEEFFEFSTKQVMLFEEIQNQIKSITSELKRTSDEGNASDQVIEIEEKLQLSTKLLKSVKRAVDWSKYIIQVNDLLPNYEILIEKFKELDISITERFGTTSDPPAPPNNSLIAFGDGIELEDLKTLLMLKSYIGLDGIYYVRSDGEFDRSRNIYIGAYGYSQKYAILTDELYKSLLSVESFENFKSLVIRNSNA